MNTNHIDITSDKEVTKKGTARSKDLSTRERANFVVSSEIMSILRTKSTRDQIPMSRIIDTALKKYLLEPEGTAQYVSLATGIAMSHLFELLLLIPYQFVITETVLELVGKYFKNFTYTRCALKKAPQQPAIMGTKFLLFIRDDENDRFTDFLCEVNKLSKGEYSESIKLFLDGSPISF